MIAGIPVGDLTPLGVLLVVLLLLFIAVYRGVLVPRPFYQDLAKRLEAAERRADDREEFEELVVEMGKTQIGLLTSIQNASGDRP